MSLEILGRIESILREQSGNPALVLADYFDYIGGTSTGAIIGTCLALGKTVDEIRKFYIDSSREMFALAGVMHPWRHKFTAKNLTARLKQEIGPETTLGDSHSVDNGAPQCHDRLSLADQQQPAGTLQRSQSP